MLPIGGEAPDFELPDQHGRLVRLSQFKGRCVVLFFYPRDFSPGCTREACLFRDAYLDLSRQGIVVVGVSRDPPPRHASFASRHGLPYYLLSDADGRVCRAYGALRFLGLLTWRITYVIDKNGTIRHVKSSMFDVEGHVREAIEALRRAGCLNDK